MMNISHLKSRSFSGKTAGAQSRKSSLVSEFSQRICLVHKLGQLGASEEFLNRRRYWSYIHYQFWRNNRRVYTHLVLGLSRHSGKSDSKLILEQFSHGSESSVS